VARCHRASQRPVSGAYDALAGWLPPNPERRVIEHDHARGLGVQRGFELAVPGHVVELDDPVAEAVAIESGYLRVAEAIVAVADRLWYIVLRGAYVAKSPASAAHRAPRRASYERLLRPPKPRNAPATTTVAMTIRMIVENRSPSHPSARG
jgi:hypothetical protein